MNCELDVATLLNPIISVLQGIAVLHLAIPNSHSRSATG